jgi:hypothetical protein
MDQDLYKMIEENNALIQKNIELTQQNQKKINKIHSHIRRTMIGKIIYWIIIIGVTVGAVYLSKPYINNAIEQYDSIKKNVEQTSNVINNPSSLFDDLNVVNKVNNFFGSD